MVATGMTAPINFASMAQTLKSCGSHDELMQAAVDRLRRAHCFSAPVSERTENALEQVRSERKSGERKSDKEAESKSEDHNALYERNYGERAVDKRISGKRYRSL